MTLEITKQGTEDSPIEMNPRSPGYVAIEGIPSLAFKDCQFLIAEDLKFKLAEMSDCSHVLVSGCTIYDWDPAKIRNCGDTVIFANCLIYGGKENTIAG